MRTIATLFLLAASLLPAATVTFKAGWQDADQFGLGVGSVVLTVDGVDRVAWDYTRTLYASPGDTWQASLTSLPAIPPYGSGDPFALLKDSAVTWITEDYLSATTHAQRILLQYALYHIWDITGPVNAASIAEEASAYVRAASGFAPGWTFVDSDKNTKQDFVFKSSVPEPSTFFLFGGGLVGLAWIARRRRG